VDDPTHEPQITAMRYGERPEVAYVLPLSVDGMLIVASAAMVEDRRAGRPVRLTFLAGVTASVAANIATAHPSLGARVVAAWPAITLLLVVEMLTRARPTYCTTTLQAERQRTAKTTGHPRTDVVTTCDIMASKTRDHDTPDGRSSMLLTTSTTSGRQSGVRAAYAIVRMRAEQREARMGDIAATIGVSGRHVRRVLSTSKR
jgi:hypothetical protein